MLLHALVLVGMGVGTLPGSPPQPDTLAVYLAMPSAMPERAPATSSIGEKKKNHKTLQFSPTRQAQPKLQEAIPQPPAEMLISEDEPLPEPVPIQEVQVPDQPETIPEVVEVVINTETAESKLEEEPTIVNSGIDSSTRNPKPETRNSANAMLAFAGNPAALGMIARDALGPGLVGAEVLSLPEPVYPVLSRKKGEEGRVVIELEISAKGKVLKAEVANSSSYPRLDRAALVAVKVAAFSPATEYGRPVESELKVAYRFELKQ